MRYKLFGNSGLRVAEFILGAMTFGEHGGVGAPIEECRKMLDAYTGAGGNAIDTAINYRGGASETIVGELLDGCRDQYVLATKYTVSRNTADPNAAGNHRKNLVASLETSLRRLRTDYVDIFWVHMWDRHTPVEETMRALDDAVRAGKVLYVGISDAPAWVVAQGNTLAALRGWSPFIGLQVPYSLLARDIERELLPMADAFGLSVAAWSPLGGGVLSGKFSGATVPAVTRVVADSISARDREIATELVAVAGELGVSPAQAALAWTRAHSARIHPIVGARRLDQLEDNLQAVELTLPAEAVARLDQISQIALGFPHDFIAQVSGWVLGAAESLVDGN